MSTPAGRTPYWKRLESWFLAAAFLILVATSYSAWQDWQFFSTARAHGRANRDAIDLLAEIRFSVREAEASQRGFVLTGRESELSDFRRAAANIPEQFKKIQSSVTDQAAALAELRGLVDEKFREMEQTIELRDTQSDGQALQIVLNGKDSELMGRIRASIVRLSEIKAAAYKKDVAIVSTVGDQILYVSLGGDLVLCILLFLAAISMHSGADRREELIAALQEDDRRLRDLRSKAESTEERMRHILDSIGDGFLSVDRDWKVTYCNAEAAKMLGRPATEVLGKSFWEEFPIAGSPAEETKYREALEGRKLFTFESFFKSRNAYWEQNVYPAHDGLSVFFRDVTERRRFEERARHSQKLESLGVLAGGIAHDFNNLLTAILGSASLIQEELAPDSHLRGLAGNVIQATERAAQLTRQMLAYSGRGRFIVEPVDLAQQVREITALLESSITAQVDLVLDLETDGILIDADSGQLQQLVMNLVINGAEAIGPGGGRVIVSTRLQELDSQFVADNLAGDGIDVGPYLCLEVLDTGSGMDEETLARIFDPFFTTKFTGRGLGLAAVLGIIRGHRGAIKVYSHPGRGTTFKVYFPVTKGQILPVQPSTIVDFRGDATVLVVDDEEMVQRLARVTLESYGYRVLAAANGKDALDVIDSNGHHISLVLLDMTMPVMSGEETLQRLRALHPDMRVIASSGYNEIEAIRRFGEGVSAFLQKPYRATQLVEKVKLTLA